MGLVVTFVFCQCFTIVADVHELICVLGNSKNYITGCPSKIGFFNVNNFISWGHFMLCVNSSVNFIFYMVHIKEFRDAFLKVIIICSVNWIFLNVFVYITILYQIMKYSPHFDYEFSYNAVSQGLIFIFYSKSFCCCIQVCAKKDKDQKSRLNHHQNEDCVPMDCMNGIQHQA